MTTSGWRLVANFIEGEIEFKDIDRSFTKYPKGSTFSMLTHQFPDLLDCCTSLPSYTR